MASLLLPSSLLVAIIAYWVYIHRQVAYNAFVLPPLPKAYYTGDISICKVLKEPSKALKYCEDLIPWTISTPNGQLTHKVIASCDPGRYEWNTVMGPLLNPNPIGWLWLVHTDEQEPHAERLELENFPPGSDFHPVGIDIYPGQAGEPSTLFVVNHQRNRKRTIDVFSLYLHPFFSSPPRLVHQRQLSHPALRAPNSVVALSPTEIFVSIDHWFTRDGIWSFMHPVESVLVLPLGRVLHLSFDEAEIQITTALKLLSFPNGLSLSPNKTELAVASTAAGEVQLYDIEGEGKLKWKGTVPVPHFPDNLKHQKDGTLLVAGHPHFISITKLAKKKQATSPTWLVSLSTREEGFKDDRESLVPYGSYDRAAVHSEYGLRTVYQSDGSHWSAGTSATWSNGRLAMTGLYTEGILIC